jgi:hypothetical protein
MISASKSDKPSLTEAVRHLRQGDKSAARNIIARLTMAEPHNAEAWVWLAYVTDDAVLKRLALRRALRLQPDNPRLQTALRRLTTPPYIRQAAQSGVFISYARPDELFAFDLASSLRRSRVNVWLDVADIAEDEEADWHGAVARALERCGLMLVVVSRAALRHDDLQAEWTYFIDNGRLVLPILRQDCDLSAFPLWLPPLDFRCDLTAAYQALLRVLAVDTALPG